ncbi:hypothetical protein T484DRAFT_2027194 [Baffinella frigidus]|nr:hypothetical protein T484DRAFT_2027194 [Cryptophyta sp. CCMP2293]
MAAGVGRPWGGCEEAYPDSSKRCRASGGGGPADLGLLARWAEPGHGTGWRKRPARRVARPTGYDVPQGVYNARPGYSAEKLPVVLEDQVNELIKSVLEHIRAVIFSTQEEAQYFLAWLAKQLQFPTNKSGVALILIGDQGVGKNIIINWYINYLLGTDVRLQVGNASRIFGGHGGHSTALINKVLCVVDKADHAALEPHMHTLKDMITGETLDIYPRSKSAFQMSNMVNLMFTTNEKNPFALEASDSHFVVFECNDSKKGDFAYFENLGKNLNNRTARAFFQFLLGFDLSDYGCFRAKRPDTQTYRRHLKVPMLYSFLSYACIQCASVNFDTHTSSHVRDLESSHEIAKVRDILERLPRVLRGCIALPLDESARHRGAPPRLRRAFALVLTAAPVLQFVGELSKVFMPHHHHRATTTPRPPKAGGNDTAPARATTDPCTPRRRGEQGGGSLTGSGNQRSLPPDADSSKTLQRSCYQGPRHSFALARIITHHHTGALLRGRATPASPNDSIVFVRPSNVLALFVRAGSSPRPRHSALALTRGVSASRTTASTTISTAKPRTSTAKSKKEAHPQDPTTRQLKLS